MTPQEHPRARIIIVLPVYNGGDYLPEQIDSILAQTWSSWQLICRDDGSTDASATILADYQRRHPDRITVLHDEDGNLGPAASFSRLMEHALARYAEAADTNDVIDSPAADIDTAASTYVALADQDDVWCPDKLSTCLEALQARERDRPGSPLLVHADLRVVDREGAVIAPSFMAYQGLNPARKDFQSQLSSNTVTGCTALMNMPLLEQALPIPQEAMMHDWWLSLVASAFGELIFIERPLVEYRQHGGNTIGAQRHEGWRWSWRLLARLWRRRDPVSEALLVASADQAATFEARFAERLTPAELRRIHQVKQLPNWSLTRQRIWFHWLR